MTANRLLSAMFMIVSALAFINSYSYPEESTIYVRFILAIFFVLSLVLFFIKSDKQESVKTIFTSKRSKAFALMIAYAILIPIVGFFVSTFLFGVVFMFIFNNKGLVKYMIVTFIFTLMMYGVFDVLLKIWFPTGLLI